MQAMLDAISTSRRREILRLVWDRELTAGEIAARFDVSFSAISQNLGVLREAGLLTQRKEANRRYYRADQQAAGPLSLVLEQMWSADLAQLQRVIKEGS